MGAPRKSAKLARKSLPSSSLVGGQGLSALAGGGPVGKRKTSLPRTMKPSQASPMQSLVFGQLMDWSRPPTTASRSTKKAHKAVPSVEDRIADDDHDEDEEAEERASTLASAESVDGHDWTNLLGALQSKIQRKTGTGKHKAVEEEVETRLQMTSELMQQALRTIQSDCDAKVLRLKEIYESALMEQTNAIQKWQDQFTEMKSQILAIVEGVQARSQERHQTADTLEQKFQELEALSWKEKERLSEALKSHLEEELKKALQVNKANHSISMN